MSLRTKRTRRRYYDPDPDPGRRRKARRRRSADPRVRRAAVPWQLRRWVFGRRRKPRADPGYVRTVKMGPRGGWYFKGPKKRRYDPDPRRRFGRFRGTAGRVERVANQYGRWIGGLLTFVAGLVMGIQSYQKAYGGNGPKNWLYSITGGPVYDANGALIGNRTPEISKLWGTTDPLWDGDPFRYLKYKFLGLGANNEYVGSAWSLPFIVSLIATLAGPIAKIFTNKGQRILRPISKIGQGALVVSTIGALALPGSPQYAPVRGGGPSVSTAEGNVPFPKAGRGAVNTVLA